MRAIEPYVPGAARRAVAGRVRRTHLPSSIPSPNPHPRTALDLQRHPVRAAPVSRRLRALLAFLLLLVVGRVGKELYDWQVHADDRVRLVALRGRLLDAGAEVIRTRAELDTLKGVLDREDAALERERLGLRAYDRRAEGATLPVHLYEAYRADLDRYNGHVADRNRYFHRWREVLARNHAAVDRYNALADSLREVAGVLGDPYYQVPSPLEAAAERGVVEPVP